jgi:hypothetical protein
MFQFSRKLIHTCVKTKIYQSAAYKSLNIRGVRGWKKREMGAKLVGSDSSLGSNPDISQQYKMGDIS